MGEYAYSGQYQQEPVPVGGAIVKPHWLRTFEPVNLPTIGCQRIQSWDTANKQSELADYSVCTSWVMHGNDLYLVNVLRKELEYPDLKRAVLAMAQEFQPDAVLIEDKASGIQLIQELKKDGLVVVKAVKPKGDKVARLLAQTPKIENGCVYLPAGAAWVPDYSNELTSFPACRYDDQVDSTSQALEFMSVGMWTGGMGFFCYVRQQWEESNGSGKPPVKF
jgi:predicted phage terminase large subunit-like protein